MKTAPIFPRLWKNAPWVLSVPRTDAKSKRTPTYEVGGWPFVAFWKSTSRQNRCSNCPTCLWRADQARVPILPCPLCSSLFAALMYTQRLRGRVKLPLLEGSFELASGYAECNAHGFTNRSKGDKEDAAMASEPDRPWLSITNRQVGQLVPLSKP